MPTRIDVSFINPPKPGKKNGSIKTKDDVIYGVKPDMLSLFEQRGIYDIEFSTTKFNNQDYKTVTSVQRVQEAPKPSAASAGSSGKYSATDDRIAERIFVCGALNASISGGHVDLNTEHLTNLVNILRLVWDDTFGRPEKPKFDNPDMGGDEVTF